MVQVGRVTGATGHATHRNKKRMLLNMKLLANLQLHALIFT